MSLTQIKNTISVHVASQKLNLKADEMNSFLTRLGIEKVRNARGKWAIEVNDFKSLKIILNEFNNDNKNSFMNVYAQKENLQDLRNEINHNTFINLHARKNPPERTKIYAGPTNSGKTFYGLQDLFNDYERNPNKKHVYCGPLRLLAYEVYTKMVEKYGAKNVGFITGEEKINPNANLLATTVEMAPKEGHSILIDEAHWLTDPLRGYVWSRLLYSTEYQNFYVLTAREAISLIEKLTNDSWFSDVVFLERKTPVKYGGTINVKKVPSKTAIVCFSRKTVYMVAREMENAGRKVGVIYGGLPLEARKKQIEAYINGKYDVMVTTDVIGHGINLPIDNVVFVQTNKFDGSRNRDLYIWEVAQIAGRAGRYKLSDEGKVYVGTGLPWFDADPLLVKTGVMAASGEIETDLSIYSALFAPRLNELGLDCEKGLEEASRIIPALESWQDKLYDLNTPFPVAPASFEIWKTNLTKIVTTLGGKTLPWTNDYKKLYTSSELKGEKTIPLEQIWQLCTGPFDSELKTIEYAARWLASENPEKSSILFEFFNQYVGRLSKYTLAAPLNELSNILDTIEEAIRVNSELKMLFVMFGTENNTLLGKLHVNDVLLAENYLNDAIIRVLFSLPTIKKPKQYPCKICGAISHKPHSHKQSFLNRYKNNPQLSY